MLLTPVIDYFTERISKKWQVLVGYSLDYAGSGKMRPCLTLDESDAQDNMEGRRPPRFSAGGF